MKNFLPILIKSSLFYGITSEELEPMLKCLDAHQEHYQKNDFVLRYGDTVNSIGIVVSGSILIVKEDYWGNRSIISEFETGSVFAEAYACLSHIPTEISVTTQCETDIIFFDISKIMTVCSSACNFHTRLIQNLLRTLATKNINLTRKMEHISQKTIRQKLLSYLSAESLKVSSPSFDISFNRQQLADYLSVDRSALSAEISKLQKEGIIVSNKSHFELLG